MAVVNVEQLRIEDFELAAGWLSRNNINRWLTAEWRNQVASATILAIALRKQKNYSFWRVLAANRVA